MALWRAATLIATGGLIQAMVQTPGLNPSIWTILIIAGLVGWSWSTVFTLCAHLRDRIRISLGITTAQPRTDAAALAEELRALRTQVSQMRETATNFDLSFDQALERLDRRVQRVEQQSDYVQIGQR